MDSAAVRRANLVGNLQRRGMSSISGVSLSAYSSGSVLWQADLFCYFFSSANPVLSGMRELASVWNGYLSWPSDLLTLYYSPSLDDPEDSLDTGIIYKITAAFLLL